MGLSTFKPPRSAKGYKLKNPYWQRTPVCMGVVVWTKISQVKVEYINREDVSENIAIK